MTSIKTRLACDNPQQTHPGNILVQEVPKLEVQQKAYLSIRYELFSE